MLAVTRYLMAFGATPTLSADINSTMHTRQSDCLLFQPSPRQTVIPEAQRGKSKGSALSGCLSALTCGNTRVIGSTFCPEQFVDVWKTFIPNDRSEVQTKVCLCWRLTFLPLKVAVVFAPPLTYQTYWNLFKLIRTYSLLFIRYSPQPSVLRLRIHKLFCWCNTFALQNSQIAIEGMFSHWIKKAQ